MHHKIHDKSSSPWPRLGLGTGTLASLGRAASLAETIDLLKAAHDMGITLIDTADSYGSGDCELLLGKAMRSSGCGFHLVSKAGYRYSNLGGPLRPANQILKKVIARLAGRQRFDASYIRKCAENSVSRLRLDELSAFLLHDPPLEAVESEEIQAAMASIKSSGLAGMVGVSSDDPEVLNKAIQLGADVIETPSGLSRFNSLIGIWDKCAERNIRLIGNHIYEPTSLSNSDITHEMLMRATAAVMPSSSTLLCGTRNTAHLAQSLEWARTPMEKEDAIRLSGHRV